jgi:hypothetical protein
MSSKILDDSLYMMGLRHYLIRMRIRSLSLGTQGGSVPEAINIPS